MMASGSARQTNGLASPSLCSATKRLIAAWRSQTERKTPCLRRRRVSLAKKPSTALQPGRRCRREVKRPARVPGEPVADLVLLMRGVVVEDHVDDLPRRDLALEPVEKADVRYLKLPLYQNWGIHLDHVLPNPHTYRDLNN